MPSRPEPRALFVTRSLLVCVAGMAWALSGCGADSGDADETPSPAVSTEAQGPTTTPSSATEEPAPTAEAETIPDSAPPEFTAMIAEIEQRFEDRTGDALALDCPVDSVPAAGDEIVCTGQAGEQQFGYEVVITGTDDGFDFDYALQY